MRQKQNYVDPDDLYQQIVFYHQNNGEITEKLGQMILDMINGVSMSNKWCRYPQEVKDDAKSLATFWCLRGLKNITIDKTGRQMFNYLTTAIQTAWMAVVKKYYKRNEFNQRLYKLAKDWSVTFGVTVNDIGDSINEQNL